jgi:hypothetical protein
MNRDLVTSGLYVYVYFKLKDYFIEHGMHNGINLFWAGGLAGILSNIATFPFDPVKTLIQFNTDKVRQIDAVNLIYRTQGYRGFFNGVNPTIIRSFYVHGTVFCINDLCQYIFKNI